MWLERLISRMWDWLWSRLVEIRQWIEVNPERTLTLIGAFLLMAVAIYALLSFLELKRRWLLRGSKMPKKARNKWVRRYTLERWIASTERDIAVGKLTESEGTAMIRWLKDIAGPKTFEDKPKPAKLEKELPLKERLGLLKKRIQRRVSLRGRMALFAPVKIPGPPIPSTQAKVLEKPKRKGFLAKTKTA